MNYRGTFVALVSIMAGGLLVGCSSNNKVTQPAPIAQARPPVVINHPIIAALPPGVNVPDDARWTRSISQKEMTVNDQSGGVQKRIITVWKGAGGNGSIVKNQTIGTNNSGKVQKRTTTTWENAAGRPMLTVTSTSD
jgi:hypothetical protein